MANASKSVRKYVRNVGEANLELHQRWTAITNHLRYGLAQPVASSAALLKDYSPPNDFVGADGKKHRKPVRALYGFGQSARERFDHDWAAFERYCSDIKSRIDADNSAVAYWRDRARAGDEDAVRWYCKTVLPAVLPKPPDGSSFLASGYSAAERHLVLERYVPSIDVVPDLLRYEFNQNLSLRPIPASDRDRGAWYLGLICQVALLSVDRMFRTEIAHVVDTITVNCVTVMRNPATGHEEVIYVLSVNVPRQRFASLNLLGVDPGACIYSLGGRLTSSPGSYAPVTPWVEADTTGDVVVTVADTPLLEMDPTAFEQLVADLLRRMGLDAQSTGKSGDGGVDCVAYDNRPIVGGKVIVQVKRYSSTVSPSVVRDLFGTVHATGATKGVLITTSGFGPESRQFAQGKPLELIDGPELDALLRQYDLAGAISQARLVDASNDLQKEVPPISPDGLYYWDGEAWQLIADGPDA